MEGPVPVPGPDVKRPRHYYEQQRMPSQHHHPPPPIASLHGNPGILPAPSTYPPLSQQQPPLPLSYPDVTHDNRNLPDPHNHLPQHSGHSTPRDSRFQQTDLIFSRRGSAAGTPRSPDDYHQFPPTRSMSLATTGDGQDYPAQYPTESSGHSAVYPPQDPHINGNVHQGIPVHGYSETGHPFSQGNHVDYSQLPVTAGPHPYGAMQYGNPMAQAGLRPKKGNRATQACDVCRTRKAKCDEGRPKCGFCTENDMPCNYQNVAPAKVDRANQQILDQIAIQQEEIRSFKRECRSQLARIEQLLSRSSGAPSTDPAVGEETENNPSLASLESPLNKSNVTTQTVSTVLPNPGARNHKVESSPNGSFSTSVTDSSRHDSQDLIRQQNTISVEHHTAAQKLFRWPSISALLKRCKELHFNEQTENYFMEMELHKGSLRLYGQGRAWENPRANASLDSPAASQSSYTIDEHSESASPASSPEGQWGYSFNPTVGEPRSESVSGGLNPDNSLKLDPKSISNHLQSYLSHIHILHPILDELSLVKTVERFKRRYNTSAEQTVKSGFLPPTNASLDAIRDGSAVFGRLGKRKHSDGQFNCYGPEANLAHSPMGLEPMLEMSPTTAMVLLVLALGKICEWKTPLPGPVPTKESSKDSYVNATSQYDTSSPPSHSMKYSPSSSSHSTSAASSSPMVRQTQLSSRSSGEPQPGQRNLDVIPGLAYYAQATDIIGNMTGAHDLIYVQCCLLAGLYAGQLANSIESLHWIQSAARACIILVKDPIARNHCRRRQNLVRIAFWSALQLESDIRAEIDMPSSGIEQLPVMPEMPSGFVDRNTVSLEMQKTEKGPIMHFYSFQLHVRKILNDVQLEVYREGKDLNQTTKSTSIRNALNTNLNNWKAALLDELQWGDDEIPSRFINDARLRGKYYGAQYIIHRPFLHYALALDKDGSLDHHFSAPRFGVMPPPSTAPEIYLNEVLTSAQITVKAAILSTLAFDGIIEQRRLVVTNIVGTAHAQFGNMLVLSAVYKSKHLRQYMVHPATTESPKQIMTHLFKRTITLLSDLKPISPTLGHDAFILLNLREVVFKNDGEEAEEGGPSTVSTSFSSY